MYHLKINNKKIKSNDIISHIDCHEENYNT